VDAIVVRVMERPSTIRMAPRYHKPDGLGHPSVG
jgi:hypothetical protein